MVLSCSVAAFLTYGDLLAEKLHIFHTLSYLAPSLPMFPLELRGEVNHEETIESWGYSMVKVA